MKVDGNLGTDLKTTPERVAALEKALEKAGRRREDFELSHVPFVVSGRNEEEFRRNRKVAPERIAFCGATPAYREEMGSLIDDDLLHHSPSSASRTASSRSCSGAGAGTDRRDHGQSVELPDRHGGSGRAHQPDARAVRPGQLQAAGAALMTKDPFRLDGRVALVTGAGSGIGRATALALAAAGAVVEVSELAGRGGEETVDAIRAAGGEAGFRELDVTDEAGWHQLVEAILAERGRLDVLVDNAGIAVAGPVETMSLADWRRQSAVNLDGVFLGVRPVLPSMKVAGSGAIINVSSVAGLEGAPLLAGYCATNGGVRLFTRAVARECADSGVRVNSVHPGVIDTATWQSVDAGDLFPGQNRIDAEELARASAPMGRAGRPEEVGRTIVWLASDAASYVTGTGITVDGGQRA